MLNIVCVKHGSRYPSHYVNVLYDMVRRNLEWDFRGKFICFTDNPAGIGGGIETRTIDVPLKGWWNKLYLFRDETFEKGDRIVYFDLDTVITGAIDPLCNYDGPFAILRDFRNPAGFNSSVMAWPAGSMGNIWKAYEDQGFPDTFGGDQTFIQQVVSKPQILQLEYPGMFVSYKEKALTGVPRGVKVVCFHGKPRPADVKDSWVEKVWKIGGVSSPDLTLVGNITEEKVKSNILSAEKRDAPWLEVRDAHEGEAIVVSGGPSLKADLGQILRLKDNGAKVFAVNNTHRYLVSNMIEPDYHVMVDARPENIAFVPPESSKTERYYASQCDPDVLNRAGDHLVLWHPLIGGILDLLGHDCFKTFVGGGTTSGMKAVVIAQLLGFRKIHLYGFDSCYAEGRHHAYKQLMNDGEQIVEAVLGEQKFRCAPWMVQQSADFETMAPQLVKEGCELHVHGEGLIPAMAEAMANSTDFGAQT